MSFISSTQLFGSRLTKFLFFTFLVLYFTYMVVSRAPASWAAWALHQASPNVWLGGVQGTVWQGSASSAQVRIGPAPLALGTVKWKLNPLSLLTLQPCLHFSTSLPGQTSSGAVCQSLASDSARVKELQIDTPVSTLADILPMKATGFISILVKRAAFTSDAKVKSLDAQMSWENARVHTGEAWLSLGAFASTATENDSGGIKAKVFNVSGPYNSDLDAQWAAGQDWKIAGTIAPQEGAADIVLQALSVLAEDLGDGVYRVQWP